MDRKQAEIALKNTFGFDSFHDEQWETINLLFRGKRVFLIEKTGFGKSLCYQFPATQFDGLTVIFSPLIALMRDQVTGLNAKGIPAKYINSEQSREENNRTIQEAIKGKLKILYIAPERQKNKEWMNATLRMNLSMVVIDEAHTISVWGHDFRPAFRSIINLIKLLPKDLPVLATTATATATVQNDIERQISGNVKTIRGNLLRDNLELFVIKVSSEDEKLCWLEENLNKLEGTGIIYAGTRTNTEVYSKWLNFLGIKATEYNAGLDSETRKDVEKGLMANRWKAVVSTNALGMGIDKSDIRFVIHTQIPNSPIHYYQEIGRAGRDGRPTKLILFYNGTKDVAGVAQDYKIPKSFIDGGRPSTINYYKVIKVLMEQPLGDIRLLKAANLKPSQLRIIKEDLIEQGIISEVIYGKSVVYEYKVKAPQLNVKAFEELRKQRLLELDAMLYYVDLKTSRMKFLCDYLGDKAYPSYGNCDNTDLTTFSVCSTEQSLQKLETFRERSFPVLVVHTENSNMVNGVAASYYAATNVGAALYRSKYENGGEFPDFLLKLTLKAFRKKYGQAPFDLLLYVPSTESGDLVKDFATKISRVLKVPISHKLVKVGETKPQRGLKNYYLKNENVLNKYDYTDPDELSEMSIILFDDIFDSGATMNEIGKMLTSYGAELIAPLAIASTAGADI